MKKQTIKMLARLFLLFGVVSLVALSSCKKEDDDDDGDTNTTKPVASFQFEVSGTNFLEVIFTNYSQNATSYSWDFGDGNTSTDKDPVHEYAATGTFNVKLTATNSNGSSDFAADIIVTDPNDAYKLLTGEVSKTWKLYREGVSMSLGPNGDDPAGWWEGLQNSGARPCLYYQEFTFHFDGTYEFNDNGSFWGEYGVFNDQWNYETCFEALPENMINLEGADVSTWLSGTHSFTYDPSVESATLTGDGAWIGIPKLGTGGETVVPVGSVTFNLSITQETGYDLMKVWFDWGDAGYWQIMYVSYSDPSLEPEVVVDEPPYGEDLPDLTPTEMYNTFETETSFVVLDTAGVYPGAGPAANGMTFTMGVADPDGGVNVGQYDRWNTYQELQFQTGNDIQFDNFTTVSVDVYMPSTNNYGGTLTQDIAIIIGEGSQTPEWWTGHTQYDATAVSLDEWHTYTFDLSAPTSGGMYNPKDRTDLDFFAISLGGGGHEDPGTFYIRNFQFD